MKLVTQKAVVVDAVGIASRAVSTRSTLQVLSGGLLHADDEGVRLSTTNMEISIKTPLEATVEQAGSVILPARIFGDIARSLAPQELIIEKGGKEGTLKIRSGESVFHLQCLTPGNFTP